MRNLCAAVNSLSLLTWDIVLVYHEITDMSGIPRHVIKCRVVLDTLADTTSGHVADMTETCRRHVADTTQNVAIWAQKRHADIRHVELSCFTNCRTDVRIPVQYIACFNVSSSLV